MLIMCSKRNNSKSYIPNEPKNFKQSINCEYLLQQGLTHHQKGQLKEAQKIYKQILKNDPRNFEALQLNGTLNLQQKKYKTALKFFNLALKINPRVPYVNYNLGNVLHNLERFDDALQSYDRAIQLKPNYAEAYFNQSIIKLRLGKYEEGWRLYEYRQVKKDTKNNYKKFPIPLWLGNESIDNKVILILNEQGLGDSIQFCRYLLMLASLNPKEIIFMVQKPLLSLFSNFNKKIKILEQDKPLPHFDYYSPLMSLPLAFKTTLGTIPVNIPYLTVDDVKNKYWQDRFGKQTKAKIGLVWSGSTTHKKDRYRSLALRQLVLLLELPFEFHSLQKEIRSDDKKILKTCKSLYQHQNDLNDFSDTAALLNQMDLIISIDTSVVHLAGALDKQVWVLLPYIPDFRWLLNRDNSPWYPSIRLFRQPKFDDWESVIQQLIIELKKLYIK